MIFSLDLITMSANSFVRFADTFSQPIYANLYTASGVILLLTFLRLFEKKEKKKDNDQIL
jgi:hypothetical protein